MLNFNSWSFVGGAATNRIDLKNCTLTLQDDEAAHTLEVKIGDGNVTYTERRNIDYFLERGSLTGATIREGDEEAIDVRFDFVYDYYMGTGTDLPSVPDAIKGVNKGENWVTTGGSCQPYAIDLVFEFDPECATSGDTETLTFNDFRWEEISYDASAGTISCSGKALSITSVRTGPEGV